MRSRLLSMSKKLLDCLNTDHFRHGLNFIKLDGDIGCLGMLLPYSLSDSSD